MDRRERFVLRVGLLAIPAASLVALVLGSRATTPTRSWWAWLPLRESPVTLLSCSIQDHGDQVWYSSSAADLTTVPAALLAVALVASVGRPRLARVLNRLVVVMFAVELGVFANAWLGTAIVGRVGLDQRPYCDDVLQIAQAISRRAYLDTVTLLGIALLLLTVLELDAALDPSTRPRPYAPPAVRRVVVTWVVRVLLLGATAGAFLRALDLASSAALVLEVGGLMLLTTVAALPVALAVSRTGRSLGWVSWVVGTGLACTGWCATWAIGFDHQRSERYVPGGRALRTFSDLPDDQLARLAGMQHFFGWWLLGLVALGLLGAALERLLRAPHEREQGWWRRQSVGGGRLA